MDQLPVASTLPIEQILDQEMNLVREAISLVARGGSPRVTVAGLRFGQAMLATVGGLATEAGVRLVPLWMPDDAGADIAVERIAVG